MTESMFKTIAKDIFHKDTFMWNGNEINIAGEWKKISMTDAIKEKTGIDFRTITVEEALKLAEEHKIEVAEHEKTLGHIINLFFEKYVEETLIQPTFLYGHPVEISPLTKKNPEDNLGSVVAELDTDKIARDVDYTDLRKVIDTFIKDFDNDVSKLFKEHFILDICDEFDINIRELIETLMEHEPYVFTVAFVKKYIRPFVTSLKNDKVLYDNSRNIKYYKPIFDYL